MNQAQRDAFYPLSLAVRRLFHKLGHGAATLHQDTGVSAGMRAVLESVINDGPQTVPQMARVRPVTRQHIQGLVNTLLDEGYVETIDNPAHKRSRLISPTPLGEMAFRALREKENQSFRDVKIDATAAELEAATRVLTALITTFEKEK